MRECGAGAGVRTWRLSICVGFGTRVVMVNAAARNAARAERVAAGVACLRGNAAPAGKLCVCEICVSTYRDLREMYIGISALKIASRAYIESHHCDKNANIHLDYRCRAPCCGHKPLGESTSSVHASCERGHNRLRN